MQYHPGQEEAPMAAGWLEGVRSGASPKMARWGAEKKEAAWRVVSRVEGGRKPEWIEEIASMRQGVQCRRWGR
jgi:hypothetical protein